MSEDSRIVCFGEMLLRLATPRGTLLRDTSELQVYVGGAEANVPLPIRSTMSRSTYVWDRNTPSREAYRPASS